MLITLQQLKSALQAVKSYITSVVPTKTSDLTNDSGFITNATVPTATTSKSGATTTLTVTDKNGTTTAQILDGDSGVYIGTSAPTGDETVWIDISGDPDIDSQGIQDLQGEVSKIKGDLEQKADIKTPVTSTSDLDIADSYGNVIARFEDGHIKTKEFDSSVLYPLSGKKWTCIGDSLTEVNVRTTKHYHDYIAELTGINVVNHGHSGAGYYARSFDYAFMNEVQRIPTDSDVITIFGSINDIFSGEKSLGDVTDTTVDTLCGCINITLDNLYARIPVACLGIVTPTPCWYQADGSVSDWTPSNPGNDLELYADALVKICKRRSIPCLDLYHESNLRPQESSFRTLAFSNDSGNGIHPDETGHKLIAARFLEFIKTLILYQ